LKRIGARMTFDPHVRSEPQLLARIKGILLDPKSQWPAIAAEPASLATLFTGYIVPVAGFAVVCQLIHDLLGHSAFGVNDRPTLGDAAGSALWSYALQLAWVYAASLVMNWLAPRLGGRKDSIGALKLAAYSATAAWVANVFLLIPWLGFLTVLGVLYTLYLIQTGAPVLLGVPPERAIQFTAGLVGIGILASLIFYALVAPMLHSASQSPATETSSSAASEQGAPAETPALPGMGKVDLSKLGELGKRLDALSSGDGKLPVIATVDLVELMPINLPGFKRTESSTDQSIAGLDLASVSAVYAEGEKTITLSLSDMGVAGTMAGLTGALGVSRTEQNAESYSKLSTVDGRITMEDFNSRDGIGSYAVLVGDRVMVKAEGHGVSIEQLKAAVNAVDIDSIEKLTKH